MSNAKVLESWWREVTAHIHIICASDVKDLVHSIITTCVARVRIHKLKPGDGFSFSA